MPGSTHRAKAQCLHSAVNRQGNAIGRGGQRAAQVGHRGGDFLRGDQSSVRLPGVERLAFGLGIGRRIQQPAHSGGVDGTRVDRIDADAFADVVRGHIRWACGASIGR